MEIITFLHVPGSRGTRGGRKTPVAVLGNSLEVSDDQGTQNGQFPGEEVIGSRHNDDGLYLRTGPIQDTAQGHSFIILTMDYEGADRDRFGRIVALVLDRAHRQACQHHIARRPVCVRQTTRNARLYEGTERKPDQGQGQFGEVVLHFRNDG